MNRCFFNLKLILLMMLFVFLLSSCGGGNTQYNPHSPPNSPNLALKKMAFSSSTERDDTSTSFVTDGSATTRWSSAAWDPQWIYIDLGAFYNVNRVKLNWERACAKTYQIQISDDSISWNTVSSVSNGNTGNRDITFPSTQCRYIRMYGTQRATEWGYSLWEFEVYGSDRTRTVSPTPTSSPVSTPPPGAIEAKIIQTSKAGDRLESKPSLYFTDDDGSNLPSITLNTAQTYQTIIGFGGSFTESAAYVLKQAGAAKRAEILNAYFSPEGSNYTLCRTHINSCDFSLTNYSYDDTPGDTALTNFNIEPDRDDLIPLIKDAIALQPAGVKIISSPWSPPGWMKENGVMNGGSRLKKQYYPAWALYFSKYIKAYATEGINIWGVTIQNEPMNSPSWEGCVYTPVQMRDFLKNNLGPQLKNDPATSAVNILIFDHNKGEITQWANTILSDSVAASYAYGTAFHWYGQDNFLDLSTVHDIFGAKHLIHTEGCQEGGPWLKQWAPAERYGHKMIGDLNNWTEGWIDWNIVLDQQGGPNHVGNYCSAPIHVNLSNGEVIYNPSYYYITHISKYVMPGAVRIDHNSNVHGLEVTAFKNPDGKIVTIIMNPTSSPVSFKLSNGTQNIKPTVPERSMSTIIF